MRVPHPFRVLCERVGTLLWSRSDSAFAYLSFRSALAVGTCPALPKAGSPSFRAFLRKGGGLFSRSRTESAFTHLSFRGAPRRGICSCSSFLTTAGVAPGLAVFTRPGIRKTFRRSNPLFPPRSAMTSTEGNKSHEPSRGLLAGGHPLPSLRPHKHGNCISRSAVMDQHPRPVSPKPGGIRAGRSF
jgi:hypothetical protein